MAIGINKLRVTTYPFKKLKNITRMLKKLTMWCLFFKQ